MFIGLLLGLLHLPIGSPAANVLHFRFFHLAPLDLRLWLIHSALTLLRLPRALLLLLVLQWIHPLLAIHRLSPARLATPLLHPAPLAKLVP